MVSQAALEAVESEVYSNHLHITSCLIARPKALNLWLNNTAHLSFRRLSLQAYHGVHSIDM